MLGKDFIQGINGATIYADKIPPTNFTEQNKTFVLSLHYYRNFSYLYVNAIEQASFKTKDSKIKQTPLSLGNISTEFNISNMTKTGLYGSVYDFSVDYYAAPDDKIRNIHSYLIRKNNIS